jgi:TonB family protein
MASEMRVWTSRLWVALLFLASPSQTAKADGGSDLTVLSAVAPHSYPALAVQARVGGAVTVEVEVGPGGDVTEARLVEVQGPPRIFRQEWYARLARQWRFVPYDKGTGSRKARIVFAFRLMPREALEEELGTIFTPPFRVEVRERQPEDVHLSQAP